MAIQNNDCCYIGRGKIYVRPYVCESDTVVNTNPKVFIGNASNFQVDVSQTKLTQQDYCTAGGGTDCTASFIDEVTVQIDVACFKPQNLALGFFGESSAAVGGTAFVQAETTPSLTPGAFILLDNIPDADGATIVVQDLIGTTYVEGVDYTVGNSGIVFTDATTIPPLTDITITYDFLACNVTELLTTGGAEVEICFDGVNAANGNPFSVRLYKVKLDPTTSLGFISDDFQTIVLTGTVTKDDAKVGGAFSQYGTIKQVG